MLPQLEWCEYPRVPCTWRASPQRSATCCNSAGPFATGWSSSRCSTTRRPRRSRTRAHRRHTRTRPTHECVRFNRTARTRAQTPPHAIASSYLRAAAEAIACIGAKVARPTDARSSRAYARARARGLTHARFAQVRRFLNQSAAPRVKVLWASPRIAYEGGTAARTHTRTHTREHARAHTRTRHSRQPLPEARKAASSPHF